MKLINEVYNKETIEISNRHNAMTNTIYSNQSICEAITIEIFITMMNIIIMALRAEYQSTFWCVRDASETNYGA